MLQFSCHESIELQTAEAAGADLLLHHVDRVEPVEQSTEIVAGLDRSFDTIDDSRRLVQFAHRFTIVDGHVYWFRINRVRMILKRCFVIVIQNKKKIFLSAQLNIENNPITNSTLLEKSAIGCDHVFRFLCSRMDATGLTADKLFTMKKSTINKKG